MSTLRPTDGNSSAGEIAHGVSLLNWNEAIDMTDKLASRIKNERMKTLE